MDINIPGKFFLRVYFRSNLCVGTIQCKLSHPRHKQDIKLLIEDDIRTMCVIVSIV